jgi:CheY-like chemotaxis protein
MPGILTRNKVCINQELRYGVKQMQEKSVLIVEDEGVVALSIKAALTKMGYTVVGIAVTGSEAIALATEKKPDVILMDIHIKGDIDGIQTTEKLNAVMDVPVIFLTAYADDETVKRAIKTRSSSYLVKPYNPRELYSNIEFAIYKHRMKFRAGSSRENLELFLRKLLKQGWSLICRTTSCLPIPLRRRSWDGRGRRCRGNLFSLSSTLLPRLLPALLMIQ